MTRCRCGPAERVGEARIALAAPDGSFGEIDPASEVGEPRGAGDAVDGGREGCEREPDVQGEGEAVIGEDERPEGAGVFEVRSGDEERGSRDGGGESRADSPGLHGGFLRCGQSSTVAGSRSAGPRSDERSPPPPRPSLLSKPAAAGRFAVVGGDGLDVDAAGAPFGVRVFDLGVRVEHLSGVIDPQPEFPGGAVPFGIGGPLAVLQPRGLALDVPGEHEVGDFLRVGGGAPDLAGILFEHLDPALDVGGAPARIVADADALAGHHGADLGPEFLLCVFGRPEPVLDARDGPDRPDDEHAGVESLLRDDEPRGPLALGGGRGVVQFADHDRRRVVAGRRGPRGELAATAPPRFQGTRQCDEKTIGRVAGPLRAWATALHRERGGGAHVHVLAARCDPETGRSLNIAPGRLGEDLRPALRRLQRRTPLVT